MKYLIVPDSYEQEKHLGNVYLFIRCFYSKASEKFRWNFVKLSTVKLVGEFNSGLCHPSITSTLYEAQMELCFLKTDDRS